MSRVTDVILLASSDDRDHRGQRLNIDILNDWLLKEYESSFVKVDHLAGGIKAFQSDVFLVALNYLVVDAFLAQVRDMDWNWPESVQIMIKSEQDETFTVYAI